ncbi:MAG: NAD-dependent protein deacetylase [Solirubrobacteraceae bacterium]|nr:NAD-dependent protein deacetylase [Solirubrobacteraceae bacterium]
MPVRERALDTVAGLLAAGDVLVLTGAGISTESGIPDYRGPDGLRRVRPMQHDEFVGSSDARRRYWARSFVGWQRMASVRPNAGHLALTRLQRAGRVGSVITQNVDGLHQRAGTRDVIELHGALADVLCLTCDARSRRDALDERMRRDNPSFVVTDGGIRPDGDVSLHDLDVERFVVPLCEGCGHDTLMPDVVFFGGSVPKPRVARCMDLTDRASALLVLGSSLQVFSGYRFVRRARANGTPIALITRGPTRADDDVTVKIDAGLGETLEALVGRVGVTDGAP